MVLTGASLRFFVTGIYQLTGAERWETTARIVGLILAALAMYAADLVVIALVALAFVLRFKNREPVLVVLAGVAGVLLYVPV